MKIVLCAVFLGVLATVVTGRNKILDPDDCLLFHQELNDIGKEIYDQVFSKPYPTEKYGKCAYECMLRVPGLLDDDGRLRHSDFIRHQREAKKFGAKNIGLIEQATAECATADPLENRCETVAALVKCATERATNIGLDQFTLLTAFRDPYLGAMIINNCMSSQKKFKEDSRFEWP